MAPVGTAEKINYCNMPRVGLPSWYWYIV